MWQYVRIAITLNSKPIETTHCAILYTINTLYTNWTNLAAAIMGNFKLTYDVRRMEASQSITVAHSKQHIATVQDIVNIQHLSSLIWQLKSDLSYASRYV